MIVKIIHTVGGQRKDGTPIPTLVDVIRVQGRFPFGLGRFCTTYLKQNALRDYYKSYLYDGKTHYHIWFGMRSNESNQRAIRYEGIEPDDVFSMNDIFPGKYNKKLDATLTVSLPILDLITDEIFRYLEMNDVEYNPLYDEGTNDRVGCYPCMLASKKVQSKMFATEFGQKQLQIIKVPGHYWHGTKTIGSDQSFTVYFINNLYDYENPDEQRIPWNDSSIIDPRTKQAYDWNSVSEL